MVPLNYPIGRELNVNLMNLNLTNRAPEGSATFNTSTHRRELKRNACEALETCGWWRTVTARLQRFRAEGYGWEPMWLAVLRRIVHRGDMGYETWCRTYLRPLRGEFGQTLCHDLYQEPLRDEERLWAAQVEFATFQDYLAAGNVAHTVSSALIEHLPQDDYIPSSSASSGSQYPHGLLTAVPVNLQQCPEQEDRGHNQVNPSRSNTHRRPHGGEDGQRAARTRELNAAGTEEGEASSLFQQEMIEADTWEALVEQFYTWFEEGRAVGMAVRMIRAAAQERGGDSYLQWLERPVGSLSINIPASTGSESSTTPPDFFEWSRRAERRLWRAFAQESEASRGRAEGDVASFMDQRYRHGRRRIRDSRTPRRTPRTRAERDEREGCRPRDAPRTRPTTLADRGRGSRGSEYVDVVPEEEPTQREPASGSRDGPGKKQEQGRLPNVTRGPLPPSQSVRLWRWLLFNRSTFDSPPAGAGKVPESFLPRDVLREVSMVHEGMTPRNRAQSTIALITVLRYLMAELSQVMDVADAVARTREGTMEQSDLDGDDGEDQANLMQHYVNRFVASEGRDTPQMRWARALVRLQKELTGQGKATRLQHVRRLRMGTGDAEAVVSAQWEQLQALLLSVALDSVDAEEGGTVDDEWLAQWTTEIAAGVPGFSLPSTLVPVESQESGRGRSAIMEEEHDFNKLLQDEEEEREWQAQRAREEEQERARLRQYESMGELEAAHLREEAGDFRAWEDGQLEAAMCREDRPGKRRCIISMEATSGSADAPRVTHRLQFEVPDDGTVVTISLRAHMAASAESTSTVPVAPTQNQALASGTALLEDSVVVHRDTVPDLLPYLTFQEYEAIYRSWRKQEQTLQQIEAKYGEEVADFLQAQRAVEQAEDVETEMRLPRTTRMEEIGKEHVQGRNPMCAPGSPLIRFPFFESMYGQWKGGLRTDQNVLEEFGSIWLGLFRAWKQWGLDAVRPALELELNMSTMDEGESAQGRCIPERSPISLPLRIPFSVVRQVFCRWRCEELQDEQVVERFGEVWLVVFQLMAEQGMSNAVHEVLSGLVDWDVTELEGSVDVAGPNGVVSGTGGVVESMTAATHTGTLNGSVSSVDVMPTQIEERVAVEEGLEQDDGEQGCIDRVTD